MRRSMGNRKWLSQNETLTQFPCTLNFVNSATTDIMSRWHLLFAWQATQNPNSSGRERERNTPLHSSLFLSKDLEKQRSHSYLIVLLSIYSWSSPFTTLGEVNRERWLTTRGCIAAAVEGVTEEGLMCWYCLSHLGLHCLGLWCFTSSERGASTPFLSKRKTNRFLLFSFSCRSLSLSLLPFLSFTCYSLITTRKEQHAIKN